MITYWIIIIQELIPSTAEVSRRNSPAYVHHVGPDKHNIPDHTKKDLWIKKIPEETSAIRTSPGFRH